MGEARDPRFSVADQGNRAPDVAERPQSKRKVKHRRDAGVGPEAERQIVVASGLEQGESTFEMLTRFAVLSGEPMRISRYSLRDGGFGRIGLRLDVA